MRNTLLAGRRVALWMASADRISLVSLLLANLLPVVLALVCGWDVSGVALFYWWENVIVGAYAILRMALAGQRGGASDRQVKIFLIPFFCFHYYFFCAVHGMFLLFLVNRGVQPNLWPPQGSGWSPPWTFLQVVFNVVQIAWMTLPPGGVISLAFIAASHGVSFVRNDLQRGEYLRSRVVFEMFRPYGRIVLLHVCLILGVGLSLIFGSSLPMVLLLILGKTGLDALLHGFFHEGIRRFQSPARPMASPVSVTEYEVPS